MHVVYAAATVRLVQAATTLWAQMFKEIRATVAERRHPSVSAVHLFPFRGTKKTIAVIPMEETQHQ